MSNKTTVEVIPVTQLEEGDTLLRDSGLTVTVGEIVSRGAKHVSFREEDGGTLPLYAFRSVLRVVQEQPEELAEEEPDADLIRIIRGTENGVRIDGSLAFRIDSGRGFRLLDGPKADSSVLAIYEGDAIFEWEEVVPVAKSAILAGMGATTTDGDNPEGDEPENDTDDVDEEETEDEDECDGTCPFCTFMRLISAAANGKQDKEGDE